MHFPRSFGNLRIFQGIRADLSGPLSARQRNVSETPFKRNFADRLTVARLKLCAHWVLISIMHCALADEYLGGK